MRQRHRNGGTRTRVLVAWGLVACALVSALTVAGLPPSPAAADEPPQGTPHPLYPNEQWWSGRGWGHMERRLGSTDTQWFTISPIPRRAESTLAVPVGAMVVADSTGSYMAVPSPAHPIPVVVGNQQWFFNPHIPDLHRNKWKNPSGAISYCRHVSLCPPGHNRSPEGYTSFWWHQEIFRFQYMVWVPCGPRCSSTTAPPPVNPPPPPAPPGPPPTPLIPPQPVPPTARYVEAALELTAQTYAAEGDFRHHGASVSSVRLICGGGSRCYGPGAPQLLGVTGQLSMVGIDTYRACTSMTSTGCDYYTTARDTSSRLQVGDQVLAAFFSPTTASERMRIQFRVDSVQVQTYRPTLRSIYDGLGNLIAYEWVWVRDRVVSVPVRFSPGVPLDMPVVGFVGG